MYFCYIDESGDYGKSTAITTHFVIGGFILHVNNWNSIFLQTKTFRKKLKNQFGIKLNTEIHARHIWGNSGEFRKLNLSYADRFRIFKEIAYFIRTLQEIHILVVVINKTKIDTALLSIFETAWRFYLQRYQNFLNKNAMPGIIIPDIGHEKELRGLTRKMKVYNPIPSHYGGYYHSPIDKIIDDPFHRDSRHSYFIQLADVISYLARLRFNPNPRQKQLALHKIYKKMKPNMLLAAGPKDNYGFVIYP